MLLTSLSTSLPFLTSVKSFPPTPLVTEIRREVILYLTLYPYIIVNKRKAMSVGRDDECKEGSR